MLGKMRMAGQYLQKVDQRYANGLNEILTKHLGNKNPVIDAGIELATHPLQKMQLLDAADNLRPAANMGERITQYAVPVGAGVARYAPIAAGLGLAGKGVESLYNMAAQTPVFGNNPADVSDPNLMVTYVN